MIIDFHTHIFPDKIAGRTLDYLSDIFGASPFADGTHTGLCDSMKKAEVDVSVSLPAVTKVSQVESINRFASAFTEGAVISFGGIHPECENYKEILKEIKNLGLKGIKLHPDYQDMYFDDIRYEHIVDTASELGLITVVHAGVDPKCPKDVHCTPKMVRKLLDDVKPEKLVLAHMGGNEMWDEVEKYLVGQNVYFDTGVILDRMPEEQFLRMLHMHGADRILFGTDSPWADQKKFVTLFDQMSLTEEEKMAVFSGNAKKLLGISKIKNISDNACIFGKHMLLSSSMPHSEVEVLPESSVRHRNWRVMIIGGAICTQLLQQVVNSTK